MAISLFATGRLKLKMQMHQAIEDVKNRARNTQDTSNEHHSTMAEIHFERMSKRSERHLQRGGKNYGGNGEQNGFFREVE